MPVVKADLSVCQGYANCVMEAPDIFDIGDEGVVVVLRAEITEADRERADAAVRSCPVSALSLEEE